MSGPSIVPPEYKGDAFNCPSCGAYAHFEWFQLAGKTPGAVAVGGFDLTTPTPHMASRCSKCKVFALWAQQVLTPAESGTRNPMIVNRLVFPSRVSAPFAHGDLPEECANDYEEARKVFDVSPRSAAALLRVVTETLCRFVCESAVLGSSKGKRLNDLIGDMVSRGMLPSVQQALDTLRVIGNEAVHPGTMDIRDDKETALHLFELVSVVVEQTITQPKKIAGIYSKLPRGAIAGITQRDSSS
jgi:Domain of unknown function (DUF4145)